MRNISKYLPAGFILGALAAAVFMVPWPSVRFAALAPADLGARFSGTLFFALVIERTVEVLLTIARAEKSNKLQAAVQALVSTGTSATDTNLQKAQNDLIEFKAGTIRWALPLSFGI